MDTVRSLTEFPWTIDLYEDRPLNLHIERGNALPGLYGRRSSESSCRFVKVRYKTY
jgi:hypothetical protein